MAARRKISDMICARSKVLWHGKKRGKRRTEQASHFTPAEAAPGSGMSKNKNEMEGNIIRNISI